MHFSWTHSVILISCNVHSVVLALIRTSIQPIMIFSCIDALMHCLIGSLTHWFTGFTESFIHELVRLFVYSLFLSFFHWLTHSLLALCADGLPHGFIDPLHSLDRSFMRSYVCFRCCMVSFIRSVRSFIHSVMHWSIHSFIHSLNISCTSLSGSSHFISSFISHSCMLLSSVIHSSFHSRHSCMHACIQYLLLV